MEDQVRVWFGPSPGLFCGHLLAVEVTGSDVAMAGLVDARQADGAAGSLHGALQLFGRTVVEQQRLAEHGNAFLIAVQFVGFNGGQASGELAPGIESVDRKSTRLNSSHLGI